MCLYRKKGLNDSMRNGKRFAAANIAQAILLWWCADAADSLLECYQTICRLQCLMKQCTGLVFPHSHQPLICQNNTSPAASWWLRVITLFSLGRVPATIVCLFHPSPYMLMLLSRTILQVQLPPSWTLLCQPSIRSLSLSLYLSPEPIERRVRTVASVRWWQFCLFCLANDDINVQMQQQSTEKKGKTQILPGFSIATVLLERFLFAKCD